MATLLSTLRPSSEKRLPQWFYRAMLLAVLSVSSEAWAGEGRKDLPSCAEAQNATKGNNEKAVVNWRNAVCKCVGNYKDAVEHKRMTQEAYDKDCGKTALSKVPPAKDKGAPKGDKKPKAPAAPTTTAPLPTITPEPPKPETAATASIQSVPGEGMKWAAWSFTGLALLSSVGFTIKQIVQTLRARSKAKKAAKEKLSTTDNQPPAPGHDKNHTAPATPAATQTTVTQPTSTAATVQAATPAPMVAPTPTAPIIPMVPPSVAAPTTHRIIENKAKSQSLQYFENLLKKNAQLGEYTESLFIALRLQELGIRHGGAALLKKLGLDLRELTGLLTEILSSLSEEFKTPASVKIKNLNGRSGIGEFLFRDVLKMNDRSISETAYEKAMLLLKALKPYDFDNETKSFVNFSLKKDFLAIIAAIDEAEKQNGRESTPEEMLAVARDILNLEPHQSLPVVHWERQDSAAVSIPAAPAPAAKAAKSAPVAAPTQAPTPVTIEALLNAADNENLLLPFVKAIEQNVLSLLNNPNPCTKGKLEGMYESSAFMANLIRGLKKGDTAENVVIALMKALQKTYSDLLSPYSINSYLSITKQHFEDVCQSFPS